MPTLNEQAILDAIGGLRMTKEAIEQQSGLRSDVVYNTLGSMVRRGILDRAGDKFALPRKKAPKPAPDKPACKNPGRWSRRPGEPSQTETVLELFKQSDRPLTYTDIIEETGIHKKSVSPIVSNLKAGGYIRPVTNYTRNNAFVATGL